MGRYDRRMVSLKLMSNIIWDSVLRNEKRIKVIFGNILNIINEKVCLCVWVVIFFIYIVLLFIVDFIFVIYC